MDEAEINVCPLDDSEDPENARPCRPTKIVLCPSTLVDSTDEIKPQKGTLSPITERGHLLKQKVGIIDDGNKRIVKLVRAFYYFPREYEGFLENEIVIAKLSDKQTMYEVYSLKNLEGESTNIPRHRAVALTPNIWKYGVKNKHFNPSNFINDLIIANRPELIEIAYVQLPVLDGNILNPFSILEKKK